MAAAAAEDIHDRKRHSVADLMDKLLEDIYRTGGGGGGCGGSVASESSTDQTNWSDGGRGPTIGSTKRLARKSNV